MNRRLRLILILLVPVLLSSWLLQKQKPATPQQAAEVRDQPDYFLRGVHAVSTNAQGQLQHRLEADSLSHFPQGDYVLLSEPRIAVHQADGSHWTIQANQGQLFEREQEFLLHGAVRIAQHGSSQDIRLQTESLRLLPEQQFAESSEAVVLQMPGSRLEGLGMELYGKEQRLLLLSTVRGVHHVQ
ncbi:MAG: LPS export ABC transporter periplasmic protein LptC [Chromatiales bacterium]|nr:LPS export ABC transporter periplasmic protein LptC [Gammaproteobacteria bacterium]MBW6476216.1 LPS export ABC transporter periplasmic protein LptC [Chromatiales bacterium]